MYLSGFNGFEQLTEHKQSNTVTEARKQVTGCSEECTPSFHHQFVLYQNISSVVNVCFTWTNVFYINDAGRLKCRGLKAGFKGEGLENFLEKHNISVRCLVSAGNKKVILQDCESLFWSYQEGEEQLEQLKTSQDGLVIQCATEKVLVALNGQNELCTADLDSGLQLIFYKALESKAVCSVSCGFEHVVLVTENGQVFSFGSGSRGQLGHGELTVDKVTKATLIDELEGIKVTSVACGGWHSTAVSADGDMYVWGWNESGQLGLPNGKDSNPKNSQSGSRELKTVDMEKSSMERNRYDTDGRETSSSEQFSGVPLRLIQSIEPVQLQTVPYGLDIPDDLKIKKISCGTRHTCVVFECGILMTCGWNNYGQLCHGDTESRDFLETVKYFIDRGEKVVDVKAECWNTAIQMESKN